MYVIDLSRVVIKEFYVFSDVLEKVIVVVIYLCIIDSEGWVKFGFVLGKGKVVFISGYIILWLELCVLVLVVEIV